MSDILKEYRNQIDEIDKQLYYLYKKRLGISRKVGIYKASCQRPVFDVKREEDIKEQLHKNYKDDRDYQAYIYLHEAMMRVSRNVQYAYNEIKPMHLENFVDVAQIGYQKTEELSFDVANKVFQKSGKQKFETFESLFQAIENEEVLYGIIPFGNSMHSCDIQMFDLFETYRDIYIVGEVIQSAKCCHTKIANSVDVQLPQARFAIIGKSLKVASDANKTGILVTLNDSENLAQVVNQFQYECVNIVAITSRVCFNKSNQQQFFIEFEGSVYDESTQRLLHRLKIEIDFLRILGSYKIY